MQTQKWVNLGLLLAALGFFIFLNRLMVVAWDAARLPEMSHWPVAPAALISFFAVAVGVGIVRRSEKPNGFLNEVVVELSKVNWPHRKETVASAGVVVVLVGIASLLLFVIDALWGAMIRGLLSI